MNGFEGWDGMIQQPKRALRSEHAVSVRATANGDDVGWMEWDGHIKMLRHDFRNWVCPRLRASLWHCGGVRGERLGQCISRK